MTVMKNLRSNKQFSVQKTDASEAPTLRFSPTAWSKLCFVRDLGESEVGGFGITPAADLLYVEDVQLVKQTCTWASVVFDDESVADHVDRQLDAGRQPRQCLRIWCHTHPGDCPLPSVVDEETLDKAFGTADWTVMFILAQGGQSYCRLAFTAGPGAQMEIPIEVDFAKPFPGSDHEAWVREYQENVTLISRARTVSRNLLAPSIAVDQDIEDVWELVEAADERQIAWEEYLRPFSEYGGPGND